VLVWRVIVISVARTELKRIENAEGEFFVDSSCIDCDLCRQIAPETFRAVGDQSAVVRQPATPDEVRRAMMALVTCPTASIGAARRVPSEAVSAFPERIDGDVSFCGFASGKSYGASSYLVVRPDGNVLVDSPRFSRPLAARIEALGGVATIFLTHRDDVADHALWAARFGATRVIHEGDAVGSLARVERVLSGVEPVELAEDLVAVPTPGHTRGHTALLVGGRYLFSGDHLWWSDALESLHASRSVCWYSWAEQTRSMESLFGYTFDWVLPGHGRRAHFEPARMRNELEACLERMRRPA
jgi:glyoxylase-like metal-dependent hydrolase (beta-lactamase superfamily II)/ferredoxin